MRNQITIDDLLCEAEPREKAVELPAPATGERVLTIPDDVWETRCAYCVHKNAEKNIPIPARVVYVYRYDKLLPCHIMGICRANDKPGECMSFAPRYDCYGICATCKHNNSFYDEFCMKEDHAPQRRVFYGMTYGGDERKLDYYGRHALSVCDDYEPNEYARRATDDH